MAQTDVRFLIVIHAGRHGFMVIGPVTSHHERVVAERIAGLQSRGEAIGLALDFESATIEQAVRRATKITGYRCTGVWPLDRGGGVVTYSRVVS